MKQVALIGSCRVRLNSNVPDCTFYIDPVHYAVSIDEVLQNLTMTQEQYDALDAKYKANMNRYSYLQRPKVFNKKFDVCVIEICSMKQNIVPDIYPLTIPYKIENINHTSAIISDDDFYKMFGKVYALCDNIILLSPLLSNGHCNLLPKEAIESREHLDALLKNCSNLYKNVIYLDLSALINKHGYDKCMEDQYHFTSYFQTLYSQIITKYVS